MTQTTSGRTEPVARVSADITAERLTQLQALFPEVFVEGKVDVDRLRAALGEAGTAGPERFTFSWAGRADAIALLQTPSRATLVPCPDESVNFDSTRHLFVEGDNLEVLKLLYKAYHQKVKLIYIDPPYNTGQDFVYPDDFRDPLKTYLQLTGQTDAAGNLLTSNPETSGRYHSAWLSMMYPRLFLARQLLRDDGVILVSIDDNEVHHLRMLLNEIFGEENFASAIVWKKKHAYGRGHTFVIPQTEYILCYLKDREMATEFGLSFSPDRVSEFRLEDAKGKYRLLRLWHTAPKGAYSRPTLQYDLTTPDGRAVDGVTGQWLWNRVRMDSEIAEGNVVFIEQGDGTIRAFKKDYLQEGRTEKPTSFYDKVTTDDATKEFNALLPEVHESLFPKPSGLMRHLCSLVGDPGNGVFLDFFAGSCTTAQAVLELNREDGGNRRFVMVQLPEPTGNKKFPTIAEIGKERIRRVIARLKNETGDLTRSEPEDLGFKVFQLAESHFQNWAGVPEREPARYHETMGLFLDPLRDGWTPEGVLWEVAVKEGYGLNSRIEQLACPVNAVYRVTDPEKDPPQSFRACLDDTIHPDIAKALELGTNDLFVCRDRALDDTLAANLALQCRLKTI